MFDKGRILSCASDLVGWRQSANTDRTVLGGTLTTSISDLFVNDMAGVDFDIIDCTVSEDNTSVTTYLENVAQSETILLMNDFVRRIKSEFRGKELLTNQPIVSGVADFTDRETQNARFVGYMITPLVSNNLKNTITHMGMQIDTVQSGDGVRLYLYNTAVDAPIATFDFKNVAANSLGWQAITDFIINYQDEVSANGGEYLLGYYEADPNNVQSVQLEGQALFMEFDCGCLNNPKKAWSRFVGIEPIVVENANLNFDAGTGEYNLPTLDGIGFTTRSLGLYAKINVECEITQVLCANILDFAPALQLRQAIRVLWDAFATTSINSIGESKATQSKDFAMKYEAELNGFIDENDVKHKGIMDTIAMDFSGVDAVCLPCVQEEVFLGRTSRS